MEGTTEAAKDGAKGGAKVGAVDARDANEKSNAGSPKGAAAERLSRLGSNETIDKLRAELSKSRGQDRAMRTSIEVGGSSLF